MDGRRLDGVIARTRDGVAELRHWKCVHEGEVVVIEMPVVDFLPGGRSHRRCMACGNVVSWAYPWTAPPTS